MLSIMKYYSRSNVVNMKVIKKCIKILHFEDAMINNKVKLVKQFCCQYWENNKRNIRFIIYYVLK